MTAVAKRKPRQTAPAPKLIVVAPEPVADLPRLLTCAQVVEMVGADRSTLRRWERAGIFPKRRNLPGKKVAWLASEVAEWIEALPIGVGRPFTTQPPPSAGAVKGER